MDNNLRLAFIGGGNMAGAIIGGLLSQGYSSSNITVSEPYAPRRKELEAKWNLATTSDNAEAISGLSNNPADVVVLAVKPQVMKQVAEGLSAAVLKHKPLIVSIAAGVRSKELSTWLGGDSVAIVRAMPNTPALVLEGATGLYAGQGVTEEQKAVAYRILGTVSKQTYWVERENLLDVVTGLSGSGPAYFFLLIECIEEAAVSLGLPTEIARPLAVQTCLGAGKMAAHALAEGTDSPAELRRKVTSPKGTTEAAVTSAEASGIRELWLKAVTAATKRGEELGDMFVAPSEK
ncbi:hypothetical protein HK102_009255 [Quaeritorhiza haematococci]|nr:hypothetical protein HK102_009255 [Quaeritorhiza haematococci]